MNRRKFLKAGSLAGLGISVAGVVSFKEPGAELLGKPDHENEHNTAMDFSLNEMTIDSLQKKMASGELSSRQITDLYLKRIAAVDKKGPKLNAVIELNPDALAIAESLDKERKAGKVRGPLHGIPVLIKDNIDTGDKMMTTAGAAALIGNIAAKDAFIIQQLRAAGAVLLGKTNLSEWANFRSTRSVSGWSSRGGQTRSPYILERNTSGSSAGSGAAVAANLCVLAIGTETDGSIVSPSSVNGIVGIKPTVGLLSRSGIIPISATQDTAGPMARTVKDAAILLGTLTGVDDHDPTTAESKGRSQKDYTRLLNTNALKGKKIGIEASFLKGHEGVVALYKDAIDSLKRSGATIIEVELVKNFADISPAEFTALKYEFKDGVNQYLSTANAKVKTLADVIAFNKQYESSAMPWFKQEILESCQSKGGLGEKEYTDALKKSLGSRKIIEDLVALHQLDALCGVTNGPAWCIDMVNGDYDTGFSFSAPAATAGYPHITVPMGAVNGLPIGFSFMAGAYKEAEIIAMAYAFEQATLKRMAPQFLKSLVPVN